jgi:hypothetical protein
MPTPPRKDETQNAFLARCISYITKHENKPTKQASAICYSMWRNKDKAKRITK